MKLHLLFLCLLVALVSAVAIPGANNADVLYPGQPCRGDWACPSSEHCSKGKCALNPGRCLKDKDCPKYMSCSDTHCFPHSKNGRRDFEDSNGSDVADTVTKAITGDEHSGLPGASDEAEALVSQFKAPCVSNTDCSSNEVCSRGHCTLKIGRCWETRDCNRRQHCINTFCYPPDRVSRRASADEAIPTTPTPLAGSDKSVIEQTEEVETADNMDVSPLDQDTLLNLVTTAGKKGNKCRRRCRYHTDCCPGDACWNMRICLGPHKGG